MEQEACSVGDTPSRRYSSVLFPLDANGAHREQECKRELNEEEVVLWAEPDQLFQAQNKRAILSVWPGPGTQGLTEKQQANSATTYANSAASH